MWQRTGVSGLLRHSQNRRYYWRTKVAGKQKWKALDTDSFTVAKLRVAQERAEVERNREALNKADGGVATMGDLLQVYITATESNAKISAGTRKRYIELAKMVAKTWPGFDQLPPTKVTRETIATWRDRASIEGTGYVPSGATNGAKTKGNASTTLNKAMDALRRLLALAYERGMISRNPIEGRGLKLKEKPKKPTLPSRDELQKLFEEIERGSGRAGWGPEIADFVRFLAYSGCRLSEANSVQWGDVNFEAGLLHIRGSKTSAADRYLPLNASLEGLLKRIRARREANATEAVDGKPIIKITEKVLAVSEAAKSIKRACEAVKVHPLTHHDFRDVFATSAIEAGVDIPTVAGWLGHSDGGALLMRVYGHLRNEHSKAMAAKLTFGGAA